MARHWSVRGRGCGQGGKRMTLPPGVLVVWTLVVLYTTGVSSRKKACPARDGLFF